MHRVSVGLRFEFRPYCRSFKQPLRTHHGVWQQRGGIILRLTDATGTVGFGEIAPVPWFGSETMAAAVGFCRQLPTQITSDIVAAIPNHLPACQFGFESALVNCMGGNFARPLSPPQRSPASFRSACSALLPPGEAAVLAVLPLIDQGYRTFKLKIGVYPLALEQGVFHHLMVTLPVDGKLRLDANGGLSLRAAETWLTTSDAQNVAANQQQCCHIEFLEQPLPPDRFLEMAQLADRYTTLIALDESIATLDQLQTSYQNGWRDVFVIKPAIAGFPTRLRHFCQQTGIDVVVSSVFETAIGQQAALALAADIMPHDRAVGFGLDHWFPDDDPLRCEDAMVVWEWLGG